MPVLLSLVLMGLTVSPMLTRAVGAQEDQRGARQRAVELNNLGLAQWQDGDSLAAVATLTQAIELQPEWWPPYNHRALARVAVGDRGAALADAEMALSLLVTGPASVDQWAALVDTRAYAHLMLGQYDEALDDYDAVLGTNVDTHAAFALGRGLSLVGLGDAGRGLADLKWGTLIAPAFRSDPQMQDLLEGTDRALASLMLPHEPDAYEPDDSAEQATPLALDGHLQSRSLHTGGDADWVSFDLEPGQGVRLLAISPTCDTYLTLHGPDQTVLWEDDDGGSHGGDAMLEYAARENGTHYAAVRHFFSSRGTCESYDLGGTATPSP